MKFTVNDVPLGATFTLEGFEFRKGSRCIGGAMCYQVDKGLPLRPVNIGLIRSTRTQGCFFIANHAPVEFDPLTAELEVAFQ